MVRDISRRIRTLYKRAKSDLLEASLMLALELCETHGSDEFESETVVHHAAWMIAKELGLACPSFSDFVVLMRNRNAKANQ